MADRAQEPAAMIGARLVSIKNQSMWRKMRVMVRLAALMTAAVGALTGVAARGQDAAGIHVVELNEEAALSRRVHYVAPEYPPGARAAHIEGTVKLRARIASDGSVTSLQLVSGHPLLVGAAIDAAKQWRYWPLGGASKRKLRLPLSFRWRRRRGNRRPPMRPRLPGWARRSFD
jgi:TonB family protein